MICFPAQLVREVTLETSRATTKGPGQHTFLSAVSCVCRLPGEAVFFCSTLQVISSCVSVQAPDSRRLRCSSAPLLSPGMYNILRGLCVRGHYAVQLFFSALSWLLRDTKEPKTITSDYQWFVFKTSPRDFLPREHELHPHRPAAVASRGTQLQTAPNPSYSRALHLDAIASAAVNTPPQPACIDRGWHRGSGFLVVCYAEAPKWRSGSWVSQS